MSRPKTICQKATFSFRSIYGGGALGGIFAGSIMLVAMSAKSLLDGQDPFMPLRLIAAVYFGPTAVDIGPIAILVGILVHLSVAEISGVMYSVSLKHSTSTSKALAGGVTFGALVWAIMTYLVLPFANPTMLNNMSAQPLWWFSVHLLFGAGLTACLPFCLRWEAQRHAMPATKVTAKNGNLPDKAA